MERVIFLVESSGERLSCMLNPESVIMRRISGVRPRESLSGPINGDSKGDNPVLFTGGGYTTIEFDLLFDISIAGSSINSEDIRDITKPLWDLAENRVQYDRLHSPSLCRFIWGKCWNIPGVISSVAERLEYFTAMGVPRRSWLRMRMIRLQHLPQSFSAQEGWETSLTEKSAPLMEQKSSLEGINENKFSEMALLTKKTQDIPRERIDISAHRMTGSPENWRKIANEFNLENPVDWMAPIAEKTFNASGQEFE